jgi:hypothetical protein
VPLPCDASKVWDGQAGSELVGDSDGIVDMTSSLELSGLTAVDMLPAAEDPLPCPLWLPPAMELDATFPLLPLPPGFAVLEAGFAVEVGTLTAELMPMLVAAEDPAFPELPGVEDMPMAGDELEPIPVAEAPIEEPAPPADDEDIAFPALELIPPIPLELIACEVD